MTAARPPKLIRQLLSPRAYRHKVDRVHLEETHISWVLLAGRYAYKIRKPVDLGFVDFTAREQRATDCKEEIRLNRRLCPDVYLGVVDVVRRQSRLCIGGSGQPVEPAVRMRRLPESGMLPNLLASGAADHRLMRRLGHHLARFHASAATGNGVDEYGSLPTVRSNWDENFAQMNPRLGQMLSKDTNRAISQFVDRWLRERAALVERRVANGRVREGHGDLHAASICVEGRRLQLFDCLEFAPRFRCGDVAAEVAFLAMDLAHRGRADLAAAFVNAYVEASDDSELLSLLDFYCCYRAYVRGKVMSMRLDQHLPADEAQTIEAEATAYFDLAWAYAGGFGGPVLLVAMGLPASGKTTLGQALAVRLGLVHLSSDLVRKELVGVRPTEHVRAEFGQGAYAPSMTRRTYSALRRRAATWLRRGQSVVLDATFGRPEEREAVRRLAARLGARMAVVVCEADDRTIRARLASRSQDQRRTASDARMEHWPELRAAYTPPTELSRVISVDTRASVDSAASQAIDALRRHVGRPGPDKQHGTSGVVGAGGTNRDRLRRR
jgi:uncharacterized protein